MMQTADSLIGDSGVLQIVTNLASSRDEERAADVWQHHSIPPDYHGFISHG